MRSTSISSVSTISTNLSRSVSPPSDDQGSPRRERSDGRRARISRTPPPRRDSYQRSRSPTRRPLTDSERKRRRDSVSSADSYVCEEVRESTERPSSRNTRRRYEERSPGGRGRRSDSRSPYRPQRRSENDRPLGRLGSRNNDNERSSEPKKPAVPPKERSLSPFSRRLALTQAMNGGR